MTDHSLPSEHCRRCYHWRSFHFHGIGEMGEDKCHCPGCNCEYFMDGLDELIEAVMKQGKRDSGEPR